MFGFALLLSSVKKLLSKSRSNETLLYLRMVFINFAHFICFSYVLFVLFQLLYLMHAFSHNLFIGFRSCQTNLFCLKHCDTNILMCGEDFERAFNIRFYPKSFHNNLNVCFKSHSELPVHLVARNYRGNNCLCRAHWDTKLHRLSKWRYLKE